MSDGNRIYDGPNMGEEEIYEEEDQPQHTPDICDECHEPFSDSVPCLCDSFTPGLYYDYRNQAWVKNGRYVNCGHPDSMNCKCYGRLHEDEPAQSPIQNTP